MANKDTLPDHTDTLRQRAEQAVSQEKTPVQEPVSTEQMQQTLHELRVHQIELEMQNEELRRTQNELGVSRACYLELYDLAPVGYLTLNEQGLIEEANLTAVTLLGMPRSTLLKQPLTRFFLPEDQDIYYLQRKHLFDSVKSHSWDMRIINAAGSTFWAHLLAIPAQNGESRIMLEDITARKQTEKTLAESQSLLEGLIDSTSDMIWSVDSESFSLRSFNRSFSEYFLKICNIRIEPGMRARDLLPGDYPQIWYNLYRRALEEGSFTSDYVTHTGIKTLQLNFNPLRVNGTVFGVSVFGKDITERKQAAEALNKNEIQYRTIIQTLLDGFYIIDLQGRFIDVNEAYCKIVGYTRTELLEMSLHDVEALENSADIKDHIQKIILHGSHYFESQHRCRDGHIVDLEICVSYLPDNAGLCASLRDITERKRSEITLKKAHDELEIRVAERTSELSRALAQVRENEERHQLATTVAKEAIWEVDFDSGTTWWNRAYAEIFNRPPDEYHHGKWWLHQIHPDDRERVNDKFSRAVIEGPDEWADNYRMMRADGSYAFLQDRAIIVRDGTGRATRAVGAKLDITDQVEISDALHESEDRLRFALENSHIGAWEMNLVDNKAFHTIEHARIFGYSELLPNWSYTMFLEHVLPEDRAMVEKKVRQAIENRNNWNFECRIRRADGKVRWISTIGRHINKVGGAPSRAAGIVLDITLRKQVEEEVLQLNVDLEKRVAERTAALASANEQLRLSNEEWLNTFNASSDPIFLLDTDHHILRANKALAAMVGIPAEDIVGRVCHEIIHCTDAPTTFCPQCMVHEDYQSHSAEIFLDNFNRYLLVTVSPIFDATNTYIGSIHYSKDITTIKEAEQVMANAKSDLERMVTERTAELAEAHEQMKKVSFELIWAEEKERERIATELHDQVGQSLLLAKMKLDALEDVLTDDSLHTYAVDASSLIETSIHDIRSLTFRMRPPILDTAGIETALEWLCSSISGDYNIRVEFTDNCQDRPRLSMELRYSLYQAVRELLLNVVKHAGTETAQLSVSTEDESLVVQVADNGVGFNRPDAIMKHVHNGGYGLYNVRQRIEQMGGRFDVDSAPGRGTTVTLKIP